MAFHLLLLKNDPNQKMGQRFDPSADPYGEMFRNGFHLPVLQFGGAQSFVGLVVISFWSMAKSMAEEITWLILHTVLALNPVG